MLHQNPPLVPRQSISPSVHRMWTTVAATVLCSLMITPLLSTSALAQSDVDLRTDASIAQQGVLHDFGEAAVERYLFEVRRIGLFTYVPPKLQAGESVGFLTIDVPFTYNSNPALASRGSHSSLRFDPTELFTIQHQLQNTKLTVALAGDTDRYPDNGKADADTLLGTIKLELSPPSKSSTGTPDGSAVTQSDPQLIPYAVYQPSLKFKPDFGKRTGFTNDIGVGFNAKQSALGLSQLGQAWKISLDTNATRRFSDVSSDSTSLLFKGSIAYKVSDELTTLFTPSVRFRWFDVNPGTTRRDITVILPPLLAWDPDFLKPWSGEVRLSINFTRNFSSVGSKSAHQWNMGPMFEVVHVFWSPVR